MIANNSITTCFQNEIRPRNGKIKKPLFADYMVKNVLNAYNGLKDMYKIKIVPVCINYERLAEARYLAVDDTILNTVK